MWLNLLWIFTCLPTYQAFDILYPSEVYHLVYSDLTDMENLFLPEEGDEILSPENIKLFKKMESNMTFRPVVSDAHQIGSLERILEKFRTPISNANGPEVSHFNEINNDVYNFTRKHMYGWYHGVADNFDKNAWGSPDPMAEEGKKISRMRMLGLQFLIHTRHKLAFAMKQRTRVREDKRYKIGYLFSRMRRIKTEMLKMIAVGYEQFLLFWQKQVMVLMRLYEQVTKMAVDAKDTREYIMELWAKPEPFDYSVESVGGDKTTRKRKKKNQFAD